MGYSRGRLAGYAADTVAKLAAAEAGWLAGAATSPAGYPSAERERRIREAAYFLAENRSFAPGHELQDWLAAEQQVDLDSRAIPKS